MSIVLEANVTKPNHIVLPGVGWDQYENFLLLFADRKWRVTYDRGALEIMTVSSIHERRKYSLRRMIEILIEELDLPHECYGNMTFKEKKLERGLAPDECYWIQNEHKVREIVEYEFDKHPPPDLVLEVDITSSSLDRLAIYESFSVPEVWRFADEEVQFLVLNPKGKFAIRKKSSTFIGLSSVDVQRFVELSISGSQTDMLKAFRNWVRQQLHAGKIKFGG